ncbi:hypothetical protein [Umezawaea sp. Da 62-37]|uniref:hypothetical protein n=1 Tax=Umezawaea sp. Da 62-37 TaxID=3075927 RepID=UPI0028F71174|nr:hypothetical protein [Umezawaea sp. Da 62-37]WNV86804.1 hypothetical protein RM788_00510 [Umezawaea sp. Da 62-37]
MDILPAALVSALAAPSSRWDDLVAAVAAFEREVRAAPAVEHVAACERLVEALSSTARTTDLADRVLDTHVFACSVAPPDPEVLAAWLLRLQLDHQAAPEVRLARYADVLGEAGVGRYREWAVTWFSALPVIGFGRTGRYDRTRWALLRIMEELAEFTGEVDLQVLVLAKDLSSGWHYLQVATVLQEAGRSQEALDWVHRGLAATGGRGAAARLVGLAVTEYTRLGRHEDAAELRKQAPPQQAW